jgi:hypothetical protein
MKGIRASAHGTNVPIGRGDPGRHLEERSMFARPRILSLIAVVLALTALSLPLQILWVNQQMSWLNWSAFAGCLLCAGLAWQASPYLRLTLPLLCLLVGINNLLFGYGASDYAVWILANLSTLVIMAICSPIFYGHTRKVLERPDLRWWMSKERKVIQIPIAIEGTRVSAIQALTFDLSESGTFISGVTSVGVGDQIEMHMNVNDLRQLRVQGRVVRRVQAKGRYPSGVGVEFQQMSAQQKRDLRSLLERPPELT